MNNTPPATYRERREARAAPTPPLALANVTREQPNRYRADLITYGIKVGRVERGWSIGGRGAATYVAWVEGVTVAEARTLADLREDLREWIAEERQMQSDAVWLRTARKGLT